MPEKNPRPEVEIKSPTAMELAFAKAQETKEKEEIELGETLGNNIYNTLSDPNILQNLALEKAKVAGTKTKEPLIQVETKPGLAIGWQDKVVPLGRVMPRVVSTDIGPLIQVETKKNLDALVAPLEPVSEPAEIKPLQSFEGKSVSEMTPLEQRSHLQELVRELTEKRDEKRESLLIAEKELVAEDASFYAEHGAISRFGRKTVGKDGNRASLEGKTNQAAAEYEQALEERLAARLEQKGLNEDDKAKLAERYRRMVVWRDVVKRSEEGRSQVREETLASKETSTGERMLKWLAARSAELDKRLGKTGGRITRVFLSAAAGSLAVAALGPASVVVLGSVFGTRIARGLASSFGGAAIGGIAGKLYEKTGGARAAKNLTESKTNIATSAESIAAKREAYRSGNAESIERKRKNIEIATALLSGAGLSLATAYGLAGSEMTHTTITNAVHHNDVPVPAKAELPVTPVGAPHGASGFASQPAAVAAAGGEAAATAAASEIPGIEVTATPGHGYEYMMKRLWEQFHLEKNVVLTANANPDSDLAQLLRADEKTIDGVVHRLAQDNEFFKGDGTSARINLDSKLTIDTNGQILLDHENILAPEGSVTPAFHAEAPSAPSTLEDTTVLPEVTETTPETNPQPFPEPVSELAVPTAGGQESQVPVESHETPAAVENLEFSISTTVPHIYANDAKSLFVYGGSAEQKMKMITEYLTKNPDRVLYAEDANGHRVPWLRELGGKGKIIQGPIMRTSGLASIFSPFMKAPSPDDLKVFVK